MDQDTSNQNTPTSPSAKPDNNTISTDDSLQPTENTAPLEQPSAEQYPTPPEPAQKKEGGILSLFVTIVIALVLVQIINIFFLQSYRVFGQSMYSTLNTNDRLIISKFGKTAAKATRKDYQPKRGEIIVFQSPIDPEIQLIKRVIGLPGDRVVVSNGSITVYNKENPKGFNPDNAPYGANLPVTSGNADVKVPENHIFVSGDNREGSNSLDSRNELGTVPEENIIGSLLVRIWPLSEARFF